MKEDIGLYSAVLQMRRNFGSILLFSEFQEWLTGDYLRVSRFEFGIQTPSFCC
jgi:hypothetical protein